MKLSEISADIALKQGIIFLMSSSSLFGDNGSLSYYCMACRTKHNEASCPKCDSKKKRVGS
ncbi:MAG: hypothetical protein ACJ705_01875 [Nitrososphaeraceae archaeon]